MAEEKISASKGGDSQGEVSLSDDNYDAAAEYLNHQFDTLRINHDTWLRARRELSKQTPLQITSPITSYLKTVGKALDILVKSSDEKVTAAKPQTMKPHITTKPNAEGVPETKIDHAAIVDNVITAYNNVIRHGTYFGTKGINMLNVVSSLLGVNAVAQTMGSDAKKVMIDYLGYDPKTADELGSLAEFTAYTLIPASGIAGLMGPLAMKAAAVRDLTLTQRAGAIADEFMKYIGPGVTGTAGASKELTTEADPIKQAFNRFAEHFKPVRDKVDAIRQPVSMAEQLARFQRGEISAELNTPEIMAGRMKEFEPLSRSIQAEFRRLIEKGVSEEDFIGFINKFYPAADAMPEIYGRSASASRTLGQMRNPTKEVTDQFRRMFDFFSSLTGVPITPDNWRAVRGDVVRALIPMMEQTSKISGFMHLWGLSGGLIDDLGSIYKLNLISGPFTSLANIIGGSTISATSAFTKPFQAAYGRYLLGDTSRHPVNETGALIIGMTQGFMDGAKGFFRPKSNLYSSTQRLLQMQLSGAKLEGALENRSLLTKPLGYASGLLALGDTALRAAGLRGHLLSTGIIEGSKKGLTGPALKAFAEKFAESPPLTAFREGIQLGQEFAATQNLGPLGQKIAMLREQADDTFRLPVGTWLATFIKATASMAKTIYNHSPVLSIISSKTIQDMQSGDPIRVADAGGRMIAAHFLSVIAFGLASTGNVTGDGPIDPELRRQWMALGWKPRTIRIGNVEFDANRLSPLGDYLVFHANLHDAWTTGQLSPETADRQIKALYWLGKNLATGLNPYGMLGDVSELFDANTPAETVNTVIGRIAGNYIPFSGAVRQLNQVVNPEMRLPADEYRGLEESMFSQIGGWRGRYRRDIFGDIMHYNLLWHKAQPPDPDRELLTNLHVNGLNPPDNLLYGRSLPKTEFADVNPDVSAVFPLSQEEADYFAKAKGVWFRQLLSEFRNNEVWKAAPDQIKRQTIESAYKVTAERAAVGTLLQKYPELQGPIAEFFRTKGQLIAGEIEDKDFKSAMNRRLTIERAAAADGTSYIPSPETQVPSDLVTPPEGAPSQ